MNLEFDEVRTERLACELRCEHCLGCIAHARSVGQQLNALVYDMVEHLILLVVHIDALHRHSHHLCARGEYCFLHQFITAELSRSDKESRA